MKNFASSFLAVLIVFSVYVYLFPLPSIHGQNRGTPIATAGLPAPMLYDSGDPITLAYPCDASHLGIPFYNMTSGISRPIWLCNGTNWIQAQSSITGTSVSIGGALLAVGGQATGSATVAGASVGQVCKANTSDGSVTLGVFVDCNVTSANTVTVVVTALVVGTPAAKTYNVRVFQ